MSQRAAKLARRGKRELRGPVEAEFDRRLADLRRERDETFRLANVAYETGFAHLRDARAAARRDANRTHDKARLELLRELSGRLQEEGVTA